MPSSQPVEHQHEFSRCIESYKVSTASPFHWLALAVKDIIKAPVLSFIYGVVFTLIPLTLMWLVYQLGTHLVILPAAIAFALIGPVFASGLYDVAWELEKGHQPTLAHSFKSMFRNPVGEWGFAFLLMVIMIIWMRLAALIHALYPNTVSPTLEQLSGFLALGTVVGGVMLIGVFSVSAFTPQIMMERKVDIMTAVMSSINGVKQNAAAMVVWGALIITLVFIGFATGGLGFIIIMPLLSYASWHSYIAVIKTKKARKYE